MKPPTTSKAIDDYSDQIVAAERLVILGDETIRDLIDSVETLAEELDETRERLTDANRFCDEHLQDLIKVEDSIGEAPPLDVLLAVFALAGIEKLWRLWTLPSARKRKAKR